MQYGFVTGTDLTCKLNLSPGRVDDVILYPFQQYFSLSVVSGRWEGGVFSRGSNHSFV